MPLQRLFGWVNCKSREQVELCFRRLANASVFLGAHHGIVLLNAPQQLQSGFGTARELSGRILLNRTDCRHD